MLFSRIIERLRAHGSDGNSLPEGLGSFGNLEALVEWIGWPTTPLAATLRDLKLEDFLG